MPKPLKANTKPRSDDDLFGATELTGRAPSKPAPRGSSAEAGYTAADIEVLEGLEPVRRRPGMYIGGTDEKALHHLFAEVIDNAMDEALAGHASFIEVELTSDGFLTVTDNGRGIPVDPHPIQARQRYLRREGSLQAAAPVQDDALEGLSVRRRRNPLALRSGIVEGHRGR